MPQRCLMRLRVGKIKRPAPSIAESASMDMLADSAPEVPVNMESPNGTLSNRHTHYEFRKVARRVRRLQRRTVGREINRCVRSTHSTAPANGTGAVSRFQRGSCA